MEHGCCERESSGSWLVREAHGGDLNSRELGCKRLESITACEAEDAAAWPHQVRQHGHGSCRMTATIAVDGIEYSHGHRTPCAEIC